MRIPPKGSQIEVKNDFDRITLLWKRPTGGAFRLFVILFLLFWLCGWFVGFVSAGKEVLAGKGDAFLHAWLAGWTVAGIFVSVVLYLLIRPQTPESMTLDRNGVTYYTGSLPPMYAMQFFFPFYSKSKCRANPFSLLFCRPKTYAFDKSVCPEFVLEGLGDEQRLRFDDGADRVVIGESLKEPEREWLAMVLTEWRAG